MGSVSIETELEEIYRRSKKVSGRAENVKQWESVSPLYGYIHSLLYTYPFTRTSIRYIQHVSEKMMERYNDPFLQNLGHEILEDECDHDVILAEDLEFLGIPQGDLLKFVSSDIKELCERFLESMEREPLHAVAWLYFYERRGMENTSLNLEILKRVVGRDRRKALRFRTIHSACGLDVQHVAKRIQWIKDFNPEYRHIVMRELHHLANDSHPTRSDIDPKELTDYLIAHNIH